MVRKAWIFIIFLSLLTGLRAQVFNGVFVGIDDYENNDYDIDYCAWDAEAMRDMFVSNYYWSIDSTDLIQNSYATKSNITTAIENVSKTIVDNDIFYFSGHGDYYGFMCYNGNYISSENELEYYIGTSYSSYACFVDACRSGCFPYFMEDNGVICSSCAKTESSYTDSASGHSRYTKFLLQGLENDIHYAEDLHNYAALLTKIEDYRMTPWIRDNYNGKLLIGYTLKDTLLNDESWYQSLTLKGNIIIPDTTMLTIKNGVNINLSTYSIATSAGAIILEPNVNISPYICVKESGVVKGLYSTFAEAVAATTAGQVIELDDTLISNITIPSGETVVIDSGANLYMGAYKIEKGSGSISIDSDANINPYIKINSNSSFQGLYPTLSSALSTIDDPTDLLMLNGDLTLTQDLTIEEFQLIIGPKSNIDLSANNKNIFIDIANNGTLISIDGSAHFSPNIRSYTSSSITGFCSSLSGAFSYGSYVEAKGSFSLTGDLTIPSGKTLKMLSNSTLIFTSGKTLYVNGTLNAPYATSLYASSGTWGGIQFQSGSSGTLTNTYIANGTYGINAVNANVNIQDNWIEYCTYGVRASNSSNVTINNSILWDNSYGVYLNNASGTISNNDIDNSSTYGLYLYNCSSSVDTNLITDSRVYLNNCSSTFDDNYITGATSVANPPLCSIYIYNSNPTLINNTIDIEDVFSIVSNNSTLEFGYDDVPPDCYGYNVIDNDSNNDGIIEATNGSMVLLGISGGGGPYGYARNSIFGGACPLWTDLSSEIYAQYCYWEGRNPAPSCYGNVYTDYVIDDPEGGSSLAKAVSEDKTEISFEDSLFGDVSQLLSNKEYEQALAALEKIIVNYENTKYAYRALNLSLKLCKNQEVADTEKWLDKIFKLINNDNLLGMIDLKKVSNYQKKGKIDKAIAISEELIKKNNNKEYEAASFFNLFNFYHKDKGNLEMAKLYLDELKENYPDNDLTYIARMDMNEEITYNKLEKGLAPEALSEEEIVIPETYSLSAAYPNPFNPSTTLEYALPVQSNVHCSIYDLAGHLVKEYNYDQSAGVHSIVWDASNTSSGIYLVRFTAKASDGSETFVDYQKVTLLK